MLVMSEEGFHSPPGNPCCGFLFLEFLGTVVLIAWGAAKGVFGLHNALVSVDAYPVEYNIFGSFHRFERSLGWKNTNHSHHYTHEMPPISGLW